jgi:hypothetical protein
MQDKGAHRVGYQRYSVCESPKRLSHTLTGAAIGFSFGRRFKSEILLLGINIGYLKLDYA